MSGDRLIVHHHKVLFHYLEEYTCQDQYNSKKSAYNEVIDLYCNYITLVCLCDIVSQLIQILYIGCDNQT